MCVITFFSLFENEERLFNGRRRVAEERERERELTDRWTERESKTRG